MIRNGEHPPFVGRKRELAAFQAHLEAARQGRGDIVFVAGEPGIGKTRLLFEIGRLARAAGWEVLSGRAYDSEGTPPYLPFIEPLRDYVRRRSPDDLRALLGESAPEVARVVAEVRRRLPDLPERPTAHPELDRYRLFEALTEFLLAIAHAAPGPGLLLVLDDLHWADKSSLLLFQHLAHRVAGARLLVASSYRTVELNRTHPLAAVLADLRREPISQRLLLPPLVAEEVGELVEAMLGTTPAADMVELIMRQTDGNPFFVRELTLHLQAEGVLDREANATCTKMRWSIPEGVREVIDRRLAQLGPKTNQMLQAAAVLGGFSLAVLQTMSGIENAALLDAIDEAVAAGMLREEGEDYVFSHALIRETLYSELSLARRRHLHVRAAEALETVHAEALARHLGDIADHYRLAGPLADPARTVTFALRAGETAARVFAYEQAVTHWQSALRAMPDQVDWLHQRIGLLEQLAELTRAIGFDHYPQAISYSEEALRLCESHGLIERAARVRCRLGGMLGSNTPAMDIPGAIAHLRTAESILRQRPDTESLGQLCRGLGSSAVWAARSSEGLSASQRGMELARQVDDEALWVYSAVTQGWHLVSCGKLNDGFSLLERAWESADRLDRTFEAYRATSFLGNRYVLLGDPQAAAAGYDRELTKPRLLAARIRHLALVSSLAAARSCAGDLTEARQLLRRLGPESFDQDSAMLAQPLVAFWSGDWERAGAIWAATCERHRRAGNRWGVADFDCWLARLRHVQGDTQGAARAFEEALAIALDAPLVPIEIKARAGLALLAAEQGERREAEPHLTGCAEILARGEDWRGLAGHVALAEAVALAADGNYASADGKFSDAARLFRHHALRWDEAEVFHSWGRALGRAGRAAEATDKLAAAVAIYEGCGAGAVWIERVLSARPRGGPHVHHTMRPAAVRPTTYPDRLSEREIQVVRLIAAGKSNREIAEALVISRNTVERHVNHILVKTGASNRTQIAGYAYQHMLEA